MSLIGKELKRIREEIGYPVSYIAEEVGITPQYIRLVEKGSRNNISFHILSKIAEIYRIPLDYFSLIQAVGKYQTLIDTMQRSNNDEELDDQDREIVRAANEAWDITNKVTSPTLFWIMFFVVGACFDPVLFVVRKLKK